MDSKSVNTNTRDAEISGTNPTSTSERNTSETTKATSETKASASTNENQDTTHTKPMALAAKLKYIDGIEFLDEVNPKYLLPVGKGDEADRLAIQHYCYRFFELGCRYMFSGYVTIFPIMSRLAELDDGNYFVYLLTERRLRNNGGLVEICGTGIWALDMAADYPNSHFTGVDISGVFPTILLPANCVFQLADTVQGLPFEDETFDFVFQRNMVFCFTLEDWAVVARELKRVTKRGGYIELELRFSVCIRSVEADSIVHNKGPTTEKVSNTIAATLRLRNISPESPSLVHTQLSDFSNVEHNYTSYPVGWNGRLGEMFLRNSELAYKSLSPSLSRALGVSEAEWEEIAKKGLAENAKHKTWGNVFWVHGRKV
ncbi:hypothetical protein BC937DRAFT_88546 [Endogone sp. FLAS-F59071]|nr:hypothetical protein BC937DRAFT_88546 [Endogone sp. FLAS-F59071]|eukprot:RUS22551.1 hypothetical protein BC937DRAFT_88546 [Endogone sp. FLAS-F59071]